MRLTTRLRTYILYHPVGTYWASLLIAPVLFACGLLLYYSDPALGTPVQVDKDGVVGVAANLSVTGLGAVMRFIVTVGPYVLVLLGLAMPVIAAIFVGDLFEIRRFTKKRSKRMLFWCAACGETAALMLLFVALLENWTF